jgi:general secretion pathway protein A
MYTAFYGLREKPFSLTPDPHFLYLASPHREALAHVLYGVEQGEGFIAVTGEVGTGKTTLCRTLLQRLGADTEVAYIFNPSLNGEELLRAINVEFGLPADRRTRAELSDQINHFLLERKRADRRVLLIIDEAQNLQPSTLEEIRLLSNLETATSKLIQILLFGQPELDDMLDSKELRQLRQRISVRWSLSPLTADEVSEYVRHRLRVAAGGECDLFNARALRELRRRARGIPRLVNLLADRALLAGYASGSRTIAPRLVHQAAREVLKTPGRRSARKLFLRGGIAAALLVGAAAAGVVAWKELGAAPVFRGERTAAVSAVDASPPALFEPAEPLTEVSPAVAPDVAPGAALEAPPETAVDEAAARRRADGESG